MPGRKAVITLHLLRAKKRSDAVHTGKFKFGFGEFELTRIISVMHLRTFQHRIVRPLLQ